MYLSIPIPPLPSKFCQRQTKTRRWQSVGSLSVDEPPKKGIQTPLDWYRPRRKMHPEGNARLAKPRWLTKTTACLSLSLCPPTASTQQEPLSFDRSPSSSSSLKPSITSVCDPCVCVFSFPAAVIVGFPLCAGDGRGQRVFVDWQVRIDVAECDKEQWAALWFSLSPKLGRMASGALGDNEGGRYWINRLKAAQKTDGAALYNSFC